MLSGLACIAFARGRGIVSCVRGRCRRGLLHCLAGSFFLPAFAFAQGAVALGNLFFFVLARLVFFDGFPAFAAVASTFLIVGRTAVLDGGGFANAGEALVGRAIGARDSRRYDSVVRSLFVWGVGIALLFTALYYVGSGWFLSMLTDSEPVLAVMSDYKLWVISVPLVSMAAFIWDGIYIGALRARYMLLSTALGMAVFLGGCYIFIPIMGNHGLWLSFVLYLAMRGLVLTFFRHTIVLVGHA